MRSAVAWITALAIIAGDRVTKMLVTSHLAVGDWLPVFPGLTITHVHNRGIAFSLFADGGWLTRILIHAMILTAVVLIGWMLVHHHHRGWAPGLGFGLILGGAIGNLIDRVLYGYVVDFIHVWAHVGDHRWAWPDFNVADSAISVGACLLILFELRSAKNGDEDEHAPDPD